MNDTWHRNTKKLHLNKICFHILHHWVAVWVPESNTDLCLSDFLPKLNFELRMGDRWFAAEKTVEWLPIFTDSVIWIFGFSPFFPSIPKLLFPSHFSTVIQREMRTWWDNFPISTEKKSHINPWSSGYYTNMIMSSPENRNFSQWAHRARSS